VTLFLVYENNIFIGIYSYNKILSLHSEVFIDYTKNPFVGYVDNIKIIKMSWE